jgi:hypothetical protein
MKFHQNCFKGDQKDNENRNEPEVTHLLTSEMKASLKDSSSREW